MSHFCHERLPRRKKPAGSASKFPESPCRAFAMLFDPGGTALLCHYCKALLPPPKKERRLPLPRGFRSSIPWLQHSLSTLPNTVTLHRQDSLPVTGKIFPGGFLPLDSIANFKIASLLSIPKLQIWPGAILLAVAILFCFKSIWLSA